MLLGAEKTLLPNVAEHGLGHRNQLWPGPQAFYDAFKFLVELVAID
ncbi:hypothetical protein [Novosphingobium beihaiensis]|uniref:Uncharacterized protein n=1 Tax=Novosphingobium beihaiensis TaxID=2930389 RepID=A0ABT0BMI0_9SPHN|nr:hypothetical protein [Novosphingobium beihaiensis]MCJ2186251.1 hypothetical protein [Novosphingobium beihaiensis]